MGCTVLEYSTVTYSTSIKIIVILLLAAYQKLLKKVDVDRRSAAI